MSTTTKILSGGGFVKIPLDIQSRSDFKVRLYWLQNSTSEKIEKAKTALLQETKEKQRVYQGNLETLEEEIKKKPYLLKENQSLVLIEGITQTSDKAIVHQIKVSQKSSYLFEKTVSVTGNFNVGGEHAVININITQHIYQTPPKTSESPGEVPIGGQVIALQKALKTFYQSCNITPLFFDEHEKWPIQNYTPLVMIGEKERKEKRKSLERKELQEGKPLHESLFDSKQPIELKTLFEHENLKDKAEQRVLVLGPAGTGKTTLVEFILHEWSLENLWPQFKAIFRVRLRNLNTNKYPNNKIYTAYDLLELPNNIKSEKLKALLEDPNFRNTMLLILDGYDELSSDADREEGHLNTPFKELKEKFPHLLITSRPQNVSFGEKKEKCTIEILGFNQFNINLFVDNFFDNLGNQFLTHKQNLKTYLKQSELIYSLAHLPMNLAILCWLFKEVENPFAPNEYLTVTSLYEKITDWLCKRFLLRPGVCQRNTQDILDEFNPQTLSEAEPIIKSLKALAWKSMEIDKQFLTEKEIAALFKTFKLDIGKNKQFGLFKIDQGIGSYIHLTFQEFFAACYLSDLYLSGKKDECLKFVVENKFSPHFLRVFWMTAGCLSNQNPQALQAFFTDLFSDPLDLAKSYELSLKAKCFEECQYPNKIEQYSLFMESVAGYIKTAPHQSMNFELLNRNIKLINHPSVLSAILENLNDQKKQVEVTNLLRRIVINGQHLPSEIITVLGNIALDNRVNENTRMSVVSTLVEIAKIKGKESKKILDILTKIIQDLKQPESIHRTIAFYLGIFGEMEEQHFKPILGALIQIIQEKNLNEYTRAIVLFSIEKIIKTTKIAPGDTLTTLSNMLTISTIDKYSKEIIISILNENNITTNVEIKEAINKVENSPISLQSQENIPFRNPEDTVVIKALYAKMIDQKVPADERIRINYAIKSIEQYQNTIKTVKCLFNNICDKSIDVDYNCAMDVSCIGEIAKIGRTGSVEALNSLLQIVQNPKFKGFSIAVATITLGQIAKSNKISCDSIIKTLIDMIINPNLDMSAWGTAVYALKEIIKSGKTINEDIVQPLVEALENKKIDQHSKGYSAYILGKIVKRWKMIPENIVKNLSMMIQCQDLDETIRGMAAVTFKWIIKKHEKVSKDILKSLLEIAENQNFHQSSREGAIFTLKKIDIRSLLEIANNDSSLVIRICYLTGKAYYLTQKNTIKINEINHLATPVGIAK